MQSIISKPLSFLYEEILGELARLADSSVQPSLTAWVPKRHREPLASSPLCGWVGWGKG